MLPKLPYLASGDLKMKSHRMRSVLVGLTLVLMLSGTAQASRAQFCSKWHSYCLKCDGLGATVPVEQCRQTCVGRLAACQQTGCYNFIRGGPKCEGPS
jgi:hypothetical protein